MNRFTDKLIKRKIKVSKKKIPLVTRWCIVGIVQLLLSLCVFNTPYWITNQAVWWAPPLALLRDAYPLIGLVFQVGYIGGTLTSSLKKRNELKVFVTYQNKEWFESLPLTYFYELSDKQIQRASDAHNACPLDSVFTLLPAGSSIFQSYEKKQQNLLGDSYHG